MVAYIQSILCDWICKNHPYWHNNWNPIYSLTLKLHFSPVRHTNIWPSLLLQMAFLEPVKQWRCTTGQWMALIRMCVMPNCSQWLPRPILWIEIICATYWTYSITVCVLVEALTHLQLPTLPHHPPHLLLPPTPTCAIRVIIVTARKLLEIQQC